jgi:predicted TIM-barrel fold metal-dependent hydrolase
VSVVDVDQHLFETRTAWRDHIDPAYRGDALAIEDDELGYAWLTWRGERLYLAEVQFPGRAKPIGEMRQQLAKGLPAQHRYDEVLPPEYTDPAKRIAKLDEWGIDEAVLFPNFGLLWEDMLAGDPPARRANLRAYNRWMAEIVAEGAGRLHGVAHMTLDDPSWAREELRALAGAGIKLAMVGPTPVNGVALAHRDLDPIWAAFVEHDVAPVFHVGGFRKPFDPAWYEADPEPVDKVLDSTLLWVAPAVAIHNLIIHGALERHPDLRIGVVELTAHWVPEFLMMMEGALGFYVARHGEPPTPLRLKPSEYFRRQVRVSTMAYEQPQRLIDLAGEDVFMAGSDWPHAEGVDDPLRTFERAIEGLGEPQRAKFLGGNARWLLNA